jgi:hypothetical protein
MAKVERQTSMKTETLLREELQSFRDLWPWGFYAGNPKDPVFALWGLTSFIGVSHAIYLSCIKPFVKSTSTVVEIGCGRGAWTRLMLDAKKLYCLDALSPEHNGFYEYVGRHKHVTYITMEDFSLKQIPYGSVDFMFSYDALCHMSFDAISEYATNFFPRMKEGARAFWMVADYRKYNEFIRNQRNLNVLNCLLPRKKWPVARKVLNEAFALILKWNTRRHHMHLRDMDEDMLARPGRWYHAGSDRTCKMLEQTGFKVVDADIGFDFRSPIIHFQK